ncbi:unnamed protein product [Rotaria socialis]|uniref:Uncharacterized protein n=1 Tax=Rotaria socialis TaxID=392032 RepID=A0A821C8P6_9BILA|nr:unnamed protein product [Rotaria socialis]CAF3581327.1 unnamed protein product [Rotaria socialis]CAF4460453.1 unnamed protein product [Rotaria socialis]CAF4605798.1 unnamed protein product [Rotaria socialis]
MNLLPKAADEFRSRDYWDQFFDKVGREAFEWYSDFIDLANVLCKYIKSRDDVLIIGCGNSTLSSDLYDTGIEQITNIDLSEKVVKQMKKQNEKKRANMKWLPMDARQMTFDDNQFSVVLDKGTVDALMSNKSEQVVSDIDQILNQVDRVLRMTGRFICITLAQKHILEHISQHFFNSKSWLLRYHHIQTSKSFALPVFAFVFTKITMKTPLIEIQLYNDADNNWLRFNDLTKALNAIKQCQMTCFRKYDFKQKFVAGSETPVIDLYAENNQNNRRYQMIVVNSVTKYRNKPFAAFIVPKSRNLDWLYSTPAGRQQIIANAKYTTVAFIYLQSDEEYRDLEQVKSEMTNAVLDFKPVYLSDNLQIPFLSSSEGIGQVVVCERSASFIIEDCRYGSDNEWKRRLRFDSNPNLIQSEINLMSNKTTNDLVPDYSTLEDDYHGVIVTGLKTHFLATENAQLTDNWLLVGLGGGVLTMKLIRSFPKVHLTGIDIDSEMVRIAKTWFGLDDTLTTCIVDDGIKYLQKQVEEKKIYDVIIFDVNNDDTQSPLRCPHPAFLDDEILKNVKTLLSVHSGVFVLNFASRDDTSQDRENCLKHLLPNFDHLSSIKLDDDINEIMFASQQILSLNLKSKEKLSQQNLSIDFDVEELLSKMIDRNTANNNSYVADVKVVDVDKRYRPGPKHYVYVIQVTWSNPSNTFIIYRRYAQFFALQCQLLDLFAEAPSPSNNFNTKDRLIPFLPGKIFLGRSQIRQVALERRHALDIYCRTLIALPERISRSRCVLEFFRPLPTDVQSMALSPIPDKKSAANKPMTISAPAKLATYRCVDRFVAQENTEMSLERGSLVQVIHKHLNGWWFVQQGDRTGFAPGAFLESNEYQRNAIERNALPKSSSETYVVNNSYTAKDREELSLEQGSFVTVLEKSYTGWWIVNFKNQTGQFPAIYLTSCKGRAVPTRTTEVEPNISPNGLNQRLSSLNSYEHNEHQEYPTHSQSEIFYVHSDFIDKIGDCVSLQRGDTVEIHEKHSSGWWLGRRLKDDYILTWIPSAFLQKEPLADSYMDNTDDTTKHLNSNLYLNIATEEEQQQTAAPLDNIYQNIGNDVSMSAVHSEMRNNKQQPIVIKQFSLPSNSNEENSTKVSVRDLVSKFNRK